MIIDGCLEFLIFYEVYHSLAIKICLFDTLLSLETLLTPHIWLFGSFRAYSSELWA